MIRLNTEELELIGKHLSVFAHAWPPKKCSSKWRGNCLCATNPDLAMEPSAGVAVPDTFVMVGPPTAELERGWPCLRYKQKEYQRMYAATPHGKAKRKEDNAAYYQKNKARIAAKQKENQRKDRATPHSKAKKKEYDAQRRATPHGKARQKEYNVAYYQKNKARIVAKQKEYTASPYGKAKRKEYLATPHGKTRRKEYERKTSAEDHERKTTSGRG